MCEELLFCQKLGETCKGSDVFKLIDNFLGENNLNWGNVVGICTDGAPALLGCRSGFLQLAKEKNPDIIGSHCMIHREALASKTLTPELQDVLKICIKVVNAIKSSALNTRLFEVLCSEMSSEHKTLLFHTEVRWLSKGNMLNRLYELKNEVEIFLLSQEKNNLCDQFTNEKIVFSLAYLADLFEMLNVLNMKLQGRNLNIIQACDTINSFIEKIKLWKEKVMSGNFSSFHRLNDLLDSNEDQELLDEWKKVVISQLSQLESEFERYFPDKFNETWESKLYRSPFNIDLRNDSTAKDCFLTESVEGFWLKYKDAYPNVAATPIRLLLQFSTTYLCESGFSTMTVIKTKYRNRLDLENDMRCALVENIVPNIKKLVSEIQCQSSH